MDFVVTADHRVKLKEGKKRDKFLELAKELKKQWNMKVTVTPSAIRALSTVTKGTGGLGNKRTSGNHPNYRIIKIGQNTEKSPGDLRRLVVTQTLVRNHQLTLV